MTTLQRSESLRRAREIIAAAELGALTGATDRAWASISANARDALIAYRLSSRPTSREFASHSQLAEAVAAELTRASRAGVRTVPVVEDQPCS